MKFSYDILRLKTDMLIFIQSLLTGDYQDLRFKMLIVVIMWLFVAVAIIIDLVSGVRKAKERGEMRTSYGFKQTVSKFVLYYAFMLFAFMFDCIGTFFYALPFITLIAAGFLLFIEGKSVLEKANEKDKRKFNGSMTELATILNNRHDLLAALTEVVKQQIAKEKEGCEKLDV